MTCPKKFQAIDRDYARPAHWPPIFKSSVSSCNFFAAGKATPQLDT